MCVLLDPATTITTYLCARGHAVQITEPRLSRPINLSYSSDDHMGPA